MCKGTQEMPSEALKRELGASFVHTRAPRELLGSVSLSFSGPASARRCFHTFCHSIQASYWVYLTPSALIRVVCRVVASPKAGEWC
jgi:hypothetical protein